jgi:predicted DNA-binding transcriptional regulator YafY
LSQASRNFFELLMPTDSDRRVRQADRLARILKVLGLIQSHGQWNAQAIAAELEVTERTVYRDLQALNFAGVPWFYDDAAKSYRVRSDYRFTVPSLTDQELLGQAVATAITQSSGLDVGGGAGPTTRKIAATVSVERKQLLADAEQVITVLGLQLADHRAHREMIQTVQLALIQKQRVVGVYRSPYLAMPIEVRLDPIRLCLVKNAWYLIAKKPEDDRPKTYRIARFESLELLSETAAIHENFDVQAYFGNAWAVYRGSESYHVRIRFLPDAARIVTETEWHATQHVSPLADGSVVLGFTVDGLDEICEWLLSWSGQAEVLEPPELRQMLLEKLLAGCELNR